MTFVRENKIIPWQSVYVFTNTVVQNHRNITVIIFGGLEMPPRSPSAKRVRTQAFDGR